MYIKLAIFLLAFALPKFVFGQRYLLHIDTVFVQTYNGGQAALLHWTASFDFGLSHFEIERSEDAQNWTKIGTMPNTTLTQRRSPEVPYRWLDSKIRVGKAYWYRLRCVAESGYYGYFYAPVVYPDWRGVFVDIFAVHRQILNIQNFDNQALTSVEISIFDAQNGLHYRLENVVLQPSHNKINLPEPLPSGCYFVRVAYLSQGQLRQFWQKILAF
jgi:hypothetical protein